MPALTAANVPKDLSHSGPLGFVWIIAMSQSKLTKKQIQNISVLKVVHSLQENTELSLPRQGQLLYGVSTLMSKQSDFIYVDANRLVIALKHSGQTQDKSTTLLNLKPAPLLALSENLPTDEVINLSGTTFTQPQQSMPVPTQDTLSQSSADLVSLPSYQHSYSSVPVDKDWLLDLDNPNMDGLLRDNIDLDLRDDLFDDQMALDQPFELDQKSVTKDHSELALLDPFDQPFDHEEPPAFSKQVSSAPKKERKRRINGPIIDSKIILSKQEIVQMKDDHTYLLVTNKRQRLLKQQEDKLIAQFKTRITQPETRFGRTLTDFFSQSYKKLAARSRVGAVAPQSLDGGSQGDAQRPDYYDNMMIEHQEEGMFFPPEDPAIEVQRQAAGKTSRRSTVSPGLGRYSASNAGGAPSIDTSFGGGFVNESGGKRSRQSAIFDPFNTNMEGQGDEGGPLFEEESVRESASVGSGVTDEAKLENFYVFAKGIAHDAGTEFVYLQDILEGKTRADACRLFMYLLGLVCKGRVTVDQIEAFGDIKILFSNTA